MEGRKGARARHTAVLVAQCEGLSDLAHQCLLTIPSDVLLQDNDAPGRSPFCSSHI